VILPQLYHWSPKARREAIRLSGLAPYQPPAVSTESEFNEDWAHGFGCICLAPDPAGAWSLSGDLQHVSEVEEWDLWQLKAVIDTDEVRVRAEFGPRIYEVRIFNPIPADRLWWVGERG
jgi:hypothetical protein